MIEDERLERIAAREGPSDGRTMARELLAARKLIDAYEARERANQLNHNAGTKMVAADVLREAKREWEESRR